MEIQEIISKKKNIYEQFLLFIDSDDDLYNNEYSFLIKLIKSQDIVQNRDEFLALLKLILIIANNHHRSPTFYDKIEQIILYLQRDIQNTFSNFEIFKFFKSNKRILLFLFKKEIIIFDPKIINYLITKGDVNDPKLSHYFFAEIQPHISTKIKESIQANFYEKYPEFFKFDEKRLQGENDSYICSLIRNDSIEEFISYINKNSISLSSRITSSIFETNSFLIDKNPSLIEYAAFFGSIQIFQYMQLNRVDLNPSLWIYAIHGRNAQLIHLLEEYEIQPEDKSYQECLKESIKCHHNEIAKYILDQKIQNNDLENKYDTNICSFCFQFSNFEFLTADLLLNNKFTIYYSCQYNYFDIVQFLVNKGRIDLHKKIIFKKIIFFYQINKSCCFSKYNFD